MSAGTAEPRGIPSGSVGRPVKREVDAVRFRERLEDSMEDIGLLLGMSFEQVRLLMDQHRRLRETWEEAGFGDAPELEISAKVVGLLEPRARRVS